MKTVKAIVTGVAALAVIGGAAAGIASIAPSGGQTQVRLAAVGAPLPQDPPPTPAPGANVPTPAPAANVPTPAPAANVPTPAPAANVPTPAQLTGLLNSLADPNVPFANKSNLVEGGIGGIEAHVADHELTKAAKNGDLPLAFDVANVQPGAAGSATADVSVSGPKLTTPVTQSVTFVNQGSWMLSRSSAMELLQAAGH